MATELPRGWKRKIHCITGLNFCDTDCDCGENNQLWWFPTADGRRHVPDWVPDWMNGGDSNEIWQWLVKNGHTTGA